MEDVAGAQPEKTLSQQPLCKDIPGVEDVAGVLRVEEMIAGNDMPQHIVEGVAGALRVEEISAG